MTGDARSGHTRFDEARWPVVLVTPPQVMLRGEAFEAHCRQILSYYERGRSFAMVLDLRNAPLLSAAQRRAIAEMTDRCTLRYPKVHLFVALVLNSAIQRGVIQAIRWLKREPVSSEAFASLEPAVAWAQRSLAGVAATDKHAKT